jgi:hypothetical protein
MNETKCEVCGERSATGGDIRGIDGVDRMTH